MFYIFLGAPGTGKGTVSSELKDKHNFIHISTGDLFRNIMKADSPLSKKINELVNAGNLIDDQTTAEVLIDALEKMDLSKNIILDGYPRNLNQTKFLENYFQEKNINDYKIISFNLAREEIIQRLSGRRLCPKCGKIYHIKHNPPQVENHCDLDNETLIIRQDDQPESIKHRLEVFEKQTKPMINLYREQNRLEEINTNKELAVIISEVLNV